MESLTEMEKIEVDNKDRPIEDIVVIKTQIFVNPFAEAEEQVIIFLISQKKYSFYLKMLNRIG